MLGISHQFGSDLALSNRGDFVLCGGAELTRQRVLRRLLTNPGDYWWQPHYGAGLRQAVGSVGNRAALVALIEAQAALEPGVSDVAASVMPLGNGIQVAVTFTDTAAGQPSVLNFQVHA